MESLPGVRKVQNRLTGGGRRLPFGALGQHQVIIDDGAVARVAQADQTIFLITDLDHFLVYLQVLPAFADTYLHRVGRVELFAVEVYLVVHQHGQPPCVMRSVAQQGEGNPGQEMPVHLMFGGPDVRLVPDRGYGEADMRVVGQQGLATGAAPAGDHPGIAAVELTGWQPGLDAIQLFQQRLEQFSALPLDRRAAAGQRGLRRTGYQIQRMPLAQGAAHVVHQRVGAERLGKGIGHVTHDVGDILEGEVVRAGQQDPVFNRYPALIDVLVDAVLIGADQLHVGLVDVVSELLGILPCITADAQGAEELVGGIAFLTEQLGEPAAADAAQDVHLEQTVLSVEVTQRAVGIEIILRVDVRHAPGVEVHLHFLLQVLQPQRAAALGLRGVHDPVTECRQGQGKDEQGGNNLEKKSGTTLDHDGPCSRE
ncbi:hypothetical protein GCM10009083_08770 [Halopseudomonas pertucinogena]|uniref:Uncharacterized protein n=1 Tax=Halopseudomonas pertucinogena TaxID=86175 RepID=A0ABQ2CLW5_9GAMM|nr:hypothetical protein GCM10009083_08770 [Halopseudomonas pertucinogena]